MINLEKEREAFEEENHSLICNLVFVFDHIFKSGQYITQDGRNTDDANDLTLMWLTWLHRAELAQEEINDLKQKLEKLESGDYVLVPKEPTLEMLKVADKHVMDCHATPESAYKVMIETLNK